MQASRSIEPAAQAETTDVRQQVLGLKKKLDEAATECGRLQSSLVSQEQLEQLLRQGRTHLQELRQRLQEATAERDRLDAEFSEYKTMHQREVDRLQGEIDEAARQGFLQQTLAEQLGRDMAAKEQDHREQVGELENQCRKASGERDRLTLQLEEREAAHKRFAEERADERFTFERLLGEATSNQRDMVQELDEHRQQVEMLREAALRAQSLAREIMRAHERTVPENDK